MGDQPDRPTKPHRPVKIPEKRKQESPFQVVENTESMGMAVPVVQPAYPYFPYPQGYPAPNAFPVLPADGRMFASAAYPPQVPGLQVVADSLSAAGPTGQPSTASRQIELRAIFGAEHDMAHDEILRRCRELPGIRSITVVGPQEAMAIESLEGMLARLGYPNGPVRICAADTPIDFIREGSVLLAVQTENGFGPGVRETLIVAAREIASA